MLSTDNCITNPKMLNPITLAYIGDVVYELLVRTKTVKDNGSLSAKNLHKTSVKYVQAAAQSKGVDAILPILSEEEMAVYKRGRNSSSSQVPKHQTACDYRKATGLEALFGYLYLTEQKERIDELFNVIADVIGKGENDESTVV